MIYLKEVISELKDDLDGYQSTLFGNGRGRIELDIGHRVLRRGSEKTRRPTPLGPKSGSRKSFEKLPSLDEIITGKLVWETF